MYVVYITCWTTIVARGVCVVHVTVVAVSSIGFDVTLIPVELPTLVTLIFVVLMLGDIISDGDAFICFIVISTYECRFCTFSIGSEKKSTRKSGTGDVAGGSCALFYRDINKKEEKNALLQQFPYSMVSCSWVLYWIFFFFSFLFLFFVQKKGALSLQTNNVWATLEVNSIFILVWIFCF